MGVVGAGECTARDRGQPVKPCIPSAWPLAVCSNSGSICQSASATQERFECKPSALAAGGGGSSGNAPSLASIAAVLWTAAFDF